MRSSKSFFKETGIFCVVLFLSVQMLAQTAIEPNGSGTETDPFQIETLNNLYWLSKSNSSWNKHFVQTKDIDASATVDWTEGKGFKPIGNSIDNFTGTYNGKGHVIDGLYISRPSEYEVGFFGNLEGQKAKIKNLGVINVDIEGKAKAGALAGKISNVAIENCYTTGRLTDSAFAGGLVGINDSGNIKNCYSTVGVVTENGIAGGLAGVNSGTILNSYSTGRINGISDIGGIVGKRESGAEVINCFWNIETSGIENSDGGTGMTTAEMQRNRTFLKNGWDFVFEETNGHKNIWVRLENINDGYPLFAWQSPFPAKENLPSLVGEGTVRVKEFPVALDISGDTIQGKSEDPLEYEQEGTYIIEWVYKNKDNKKYMTTQKQELIVKHETNGTEISDINVFIYPNPLGHNLHVETGEQGIQRLTITDRSGVTKIEKKNLKNKQVIDVSELTTGIYNLVIETETDSFSRKIFKK